MHAELTQKHSFQNTQKFKIIAQKALSPEHRERADTDARCPFNGTIEWNILTLPDLKHRPKTGFY